MGKQGTTTQFVRSVAVHSLRGRYGHGYFCRSTVNARFLPSLLLAALLFLAGGSLANAQDKGNDKDKDADKKEADAGPANSTIEKGKYTADELLNMGLTAYRAQRWEEAINAFGAFLRDYGAAREAAGAITRVRPLIAVSLAQLKRWDEALRAIDEVMPLEKEVDPGTLELIYFWRGVAHFYLDEYAPAREGLTEFAKKFPQSPKFTEAVLLQASSYVEEADWEGAVTFCKVAENNVKGTERSQLVIMHLYSLLESNQLDPAYDLVTAEFEHLDDMVQLAAFQSMTLRLSVLYMVEGKNYRAIGCIQRLWPREEIEAKQQERLAGLKQRLAALETQRGDPFLQHKLRLLIGKIEREIKSFERNQNWNSSIGFRLAAVYLKMERYREAALILKDLVTKLPPDPVLEQAGNNMVRCWAQVGRWPEVVASADQFAAKFPKAETLPEVLFLKGQALEQDLREEDARQVLLKVRDDFPKSAIRPEADFHQAYCLVLSEEYPQAALEFDRIYKEKTSPEHAAMALYWKGNALSMGKQMKESKEALIQYLNEFPKGESVMDATYRVAYCVHSLGDYPASAKALAEFLKKYPNSPDRFEAQVLEGEAYLAMGKLDEGIKILRAMPKDDPAMFAEAWFKIGKALKVNKRDEELREHMAQFEKEMPDSNRLAEALSWQGATYRNEPDKAREVYLAAVRRLGNDPSQTSLTEIFRSLARLYRSDRDAYIEQLDQLRQEAVSSKKETLQLYTLWAEADVLHKTEPDRARVSLLEAAKYLKVQEDNPELMADIADAERASGKKEEASKLYRDLRKWNPRAMQRDRSFTGLAEMAEADGNTEEAMKWYSRLERELPGSPLLPATRLALGKLLSAQFKYKEASAKVEPILTQRGVSAQIKARAMLLVADNSMAMNKADEAIPYYEKIYLLYGRYAPEAAQAYIGHGKALEKQGKLVEAAGVYRDMLAREGLKDLPQAQEARDRMAKLPAPAPVEAANPS